MKHFTGFISVIILVAGCNNNTSPAANETVHNADSPKTGSIAASAGKLLFEQKCAACHGSDGTAGIANATNLQTSKSDSLSVIQIISNGKNAMPSFKSQLTDEKIHQLANYLYSLRK